MDYRQKQYFRAMWITIIIGCLLVVFMCSDSRAEDPSNISIPVVVHEVESDDAWSKLVVISPDGEMHVFFTDPMWEVKKGDSLKLEFYVHKIMNVQVVSPYLVMDLNGTRVEL